MSRKNGLLREISIKVWSFR